jgi:3D (Asp-Asp-Asp) domain-containing protein
MNTNSKSSDPYKRILIILMAIFLVTFSALQVESFVKLDKDETQNFESLTIATGNSLLPIINYGNTNNTGRMDVLITAYSSTVSQTDDTPFTTASNKQVVDGIVANNLLPFGTKIKFPELYGDKVFVVEDRMHKRKSDNQFDIWFNSYEDAVQFGVQETYVEVLEN